MLAEAYKRLRARTPGRDDAPRRGRLHGAGAGAVSRRHQARRSRRPASPDEFTYHGAVDRDGKLAFLQSLDVLSVPAPYDEPKGVFLLEAMGERRAGRAAAPRRLHRDRREDRRRRARAARRSAGARRRAARALAGSRRGATRLGRARLRRRPRALQHPALDRSAAGRCTTSVDESPSGGRRPRCCKVTDLSKEYPTPRGPLRVLSRRVVRHGAGRRRGDHGAVGQRQELAALHPRRARAADRPAP